MNIRIFEDKIRTLLLDRLNEDIDDFSSIYQGDDGLIRINEKTKIYSIDEENNVLRSKSLAYIEDDVYTIDITEEINNYLNNSNDNYCTVIIDKIINNINNTINSLCKKCNYNNIEKHIYYKNNTVLINKIDDYYNLSYCIAIALICDE